MRSKLMIPLALLALVAAVAMFVQADVPQNMNVQGRLTDSAGDPVGPLVLIFTFKIYDMEVGGTEIWPAGPGETHAVATDDNGIWGATVGEFLGLPPSVFSDTVRWLEITVDNGVDPAETLSRTKLNTSPYGGRSARSATSKVADNGVPLGTVIDWWRPNAGFPVPTDYLICDGSVVNDPDSPYDGESLPDLRNAFARGANTAGDIGNTGGADAHQHGISLTTGSHTHAVDPPNWGTTTVFSHNSALGAILNSNHAHVGTHGHTFNLPPTTSTGSTASVNGNTASTGNVPSYVALLKIMKVK